MAQEDSWKFWKRENEVDEKWIQFVDDNALAELPKGTRVIGAFPHGASYWTRTAEIQTEQPDGSPESVLIKLAQGDIGKAMVSGEFHSMTTMHQIIPDATPAPIAWGTHTSNPNIHFFLCRFVDVIDEVPEVETFTVKVAELHAQSSSPNGKYGFPVPTYMGQMAQYHTWTESLMVTIEESQGPDEELRELFGQTMSMVVPRLLRPLETGGRQIKPSLVQGDLNSGNVSVDVETGRPVLYDATCLYAHNEWDLAPWRLARHKIGKPFMKAYFRHFPILSPEEDQEDRSVLYCLRWDMKGMVIYPGDVRYRTYCVDAMKALVEKFPDGYEAGQGIKEKI